jgi:uncharacterized protein
MNVAGEYPMQYSRARTWAALNDPQVIRKCTPGCQSMDIVAPNHYKMVVKIGVASISGTYKGSLELCDKRDQEQYSMVVEGAGPIGTVNVTGNVMLRGSADGHTTIAYNFDARVGGANTGLAQRGLVPIAKYLIKQFFGNVAREIAAKDSATQADATQDIDR